MLQRKKRIEWIDVAKGITILTMIVGHSLDFYALSRAIIFSFHMPLFFILSGYTFKSATSGRMLIQQGKKDFFRLIVPVVICSFSFTFYKYIIGEHTLENLVHLLYSNMCGLYWSTGYSPEHTSIGILWFLVSLYLARQFVNLIHLGFKTEKNWVIVFAVGLLGLFFAQENLIFPLGLETVPISMMFIQIGILARQKCQEIKKYTTIIFCLSVVVWACCIYNGVYLEMAARTYPFGIVSVVEAVAGAFIVCVISSALCANLAIKKIGAFLGKNTIIVFYVHYFDAIWGCIWQNGNVALEILLRLATDLLITNIVILLKKSSKKYYMKKGGLLEN